MTDRAHPTPPRSTRSTCAIPARYAARGYPDDVWTQLRAEAPVAWFEPEGYEPFWAITKHADILDVASQPVRFSNEHGLMIGPKGASGQPIEMVVTLDPPRHGPLRRVAMRRFTPRAIKAHNDEIEALALEVLDGIAGAAAGGEEFDFVQHVAAPLADRGDRVVPRRAPGRPRAAVPLDQRGHRQGRSRVPPARRDPGPDAQARTHRDAHVSRPSWSSGTGANRATTS